MNHADYQESSDVSRRELLKGAAGGAALAAMGWSGAAARAEDKPAAAPLKGRIRQSAVSGVFGRMSLEKRCELCVQLGLKGMDFIAPNDWPTLKKYGLICTMVSGGCPPFNRTENHARCVEALHKSIDLAAEAGFPNVIVMSGNRHMDKNDKVGISDEEGAANCVEGLKKIASFAEEKKVTVCMELLNSKRNHPDYQCDHTAWGAAVMKKVGSPRIKLLYDIYHMQVQEGDIIATIRENIQYIAHFHTAGVPGRNEIDDTQELYYPAVMRAIVDLKFEGYVAHEYSPRRDPVESLKQAVAICDV